MHGSLVSTVAMRERECPDPQDFADGCTRDQRHASDYPPHTPASMSIHPKHPSSQDPAIAGGGSNGSRITPKDRLPALERLISVGNPRLGAQKLARNASAHGIDLDLLWGVLGNQNEGQPAVKQVCMVVPGTGGTGMCFVSNPKLKSGAPDPRFGDLQTQIREISASLHAAIQQLPQVASDRVRIAQMLFEPDQAWTHEVCTNAGMTCVGTLDYMRMDYGLISTWDSGSDLSNPWPDDITVRPIRDLSMSSPTKDGSLLGIALESSYEGTLDCPELCGMRTMSDVIASHQSTGEFDPSRWWLMLKDSRPVGCCLLSHCPANNSVELVYLGMSPEVQGRGLGTRLLSFALQSLRIDEPVHEVTCAVDRRNIPAAKVYSRLGFKRFDARCGYVRPV